jgi:hypothetical protein
MYTQSVTRRRQRTGVRRNNGRTATQTREGKEISAIAPEYLAEMPVELLGRAEAELHLGMYHEALEDADSYIRMTGADELGLYVRGVARIKYGIPQLFDLGIADLEQAAEKGSERAMEMLIRMGNVLAA